MGLYLHKRRRSCEVLSDPQKRAVYDQYGEEGLKGQVPQSDGGGAGGATFYQTGDGSNEFRFNPRNANDFFAEFFGNSNPFGGMGGGMGGPASMRGGSSRFSGGMFGDDMFSSFGGSRPMSSGPRKAPPVENRLPCSLEELFKGTTKKMKISREIADASGSFNSCQVWNCSWSRIAWTNGIGKAVISFKSVVPVPLQVKSVSFPKCGIDYQDYTPCIDPNVLD